MSVQIAIISAGSRVGVYTQLDLWDPLCFYLFCPQLWLYLDGFFTSVVAVSARTAALITSTLFFVESLDKRPADWGTVAKGIMKDSNDGGEETEKQEREG